MNKTVSIILIVILSLLTLVVTGFFIYLMSGGSFNWSFNFNSYSDNLIDSKELSSINEIVVDAKNTNILVEKSNDNKIHVELYSDNEVEHSIKLENNKLEIQFYDNSIFNFFKKHNRVLVKIPNDYSNKLNINLTTGDVKFQSFDKLSPFIKIGTGDVQADSLKEVQIDASTGDIKINNIDKITCKLTTGDIKLEKVKDANIHGVTGNVKIQEITNSADITLTTGDVKIQSANINEDSYISLTTGDVKIRSVTGAYIETTNSIGDVKVNNNDRKSEKTLKISVNVGDIKVNQ